MYDAPGGTPLLRLSWNGLDPNYIATFAMDAQVGFGEALFDSMAQRHMNEGRISSQRARST